jgi:hypothetical protein
MQVVQTLQAEAYHARSDFYQQIRLKINESQEFLEKPTFSDEKTYHINGQVNDCVWEGRYIKKSGNTKENPQKLNFYCTLRKSSIISPSFF